MFSGDKLPGDRGRHLPDRGEGAVHLVDDGNRAGRCVLLPHHGRRLRHLSRLVHWMLRIALQEEKHSTCRT